MGRENFTVRTIDFADTVIRHCMPVWVPSLSVMLGAATMCASLVYKLLRVTDVKTI